MLNVLEINGLRQELVLERLADANVIYMEGGNDRQPEPLLYMGCAGRRTRPIAVPRMARDRARRGR